MNITAIKTFKRYELKYFVTPEQYQMIRDELEKYMVLDSFCLDGDSYPIYNLYFDTENDDIIRKSLAKPYYKEKLRMRSYAMPLHGTDTVFLELKKKIGGIVTKRRTVLTFSQAVDFIESGIFPDTDNYKDSQVLAEIVDFLDRYPARPKVFIRYERTAFFGKNDPELRVSFDKNIRTRREEIHFAGGDYGAGLFPDGRILMEIKCNGHVPLWLCRLLSAMKIYKTNFSKYGMEYSTFIGSKKDFAKRSSGKKSA